MNTRGSWAAGEDQGINADADKRMHKSNDTMLAAYIVRVDIVLSRQPHREIFSLFHVSFDPLLERVGVMRVGENFKIGMPSSSALCMHLC